MEAKPALIANRDARHLELHLRGLSLPPSRPFDSDDLYRLIHRLGYVQLDSIRMVERAHHMILFARNRNYRREDLACLMERKRRLFEHWTHDAAVIPTEFYPHWHYRFEQEAGSARARRKRESGSLMGKASHVLRRIRREGALFARDFPDPGHTRGTDGWWEWGPSKEALDYLWRTGSLAVSERRNFQKRYDLTERVIPARFRRARPETAATIDWKCSAALDRLGVASAGEIADFWGSVPIRDVHDWIRSGLRDGLRRVTVAGAAHRRPRQLIARENVFEQIASADSPPGSLRLISPFDPLIRTRGRAAQLFGFDYRIEVFVPRKLRRYGYYVFPILEGHRFIGRAEVIARRKQGVLRLENLWMEPGFGMSGRRRDRLEAELDRLAGFSDCARVEFAVAPGSDRDGRDCGHARSWPPGAPGSCAHR